MSESENQGEQQKQPPPPPPRPSRASPQDGGPEQDPKPSQPSEAGEQPPTSQASGQQSPPSASGQEPTSQPSEGSGQQKPPTLPSEDGGKQPSPDSFMVTRPEPSSAPAQLSQHKTQNVPPSQPLEDVGGLSERSPLIPGRPGIGRGGDVQIGEWPFEQVGTYQPGPLIIPQPRGLRRKATFIVELFYHAGILIGAIVMVIMGLIYCDENECPLMKRYYLWVVLVLCGLVIVIHQVVFIWCRYSNCVHDHLLQNPHRACAFQSCSIFINAILAGCLFFETVVLYMKYGSAALENTRSPLYCNKRFFFYTFAMSLIFLALLFFNFCFLAYRCVMIRLYPVEKENIDRP